MKNLDLRSVLIGVLLTMLIVTFTMMAMAEKSPHTWDYKLVRAFMGSDYERAMNDAATDGWEVVAIGPPPTSGDTRAFAVMKRPRARQPVSWWKFWKK